MIFKDGAPLGEIEGFPWKNGEMYEISVEDINADASWNCRGQILPQEVFELSTSIANNGQLMPGIGRIVNGRVELVAGFRRFEAVRINRLPTYKIIIRLDITEEEAQMVNFTENLNRTDLTILQEAKAIEKFERKGWSREKIASKIGKGDGWVQVRLMLLYMPEEIQEAAHKGKLTLMNIRDLNGFTSPSEMVSAFKDLMDRKDTGEKAPKVRKPSVSKQNRAIMCKQRGKNDINALQSHMAFFGLPPGLHTRCLAWASGYISDVDLAVDIKEYAKGHDKNYVFPPNGFPESDSDL